MVGMITPIELVEWFMKDRNQQFALKLDQVIMDHMDIPERIACAVQARLEYILPVLPSWHEAMALGALHNTITTAHQLEEIVTLIAQKVGPLSSTLERSAIGAVYVATELHLLTDTSPNYRDTWDFLNTRVYEWHTLVQHQRNPLNSDAMVASAAVVSSLAGGLVSLAPPVIAKGITLSLVPHLMAMIMPMTTAGSDSNVKDPSRTPGSAPEDYADLPPFPSDAK